MFTFKTRSIGSVIALVVLVAALLIPSAALAEGEEPPVPDAPAGEVTEAPEEVQAPAETQETVPAGELPTEEFAPTEETVPVSEDVAAVVEVLAETGSVLLDQNGETIPLASEAAAQALASADPWFESGGTTYRYLPTGGDCSSYAAGTCFVSSTPIQDAIDDPLSTGQIIHIEPGTYNEQLLISKDVSLAGSGEGSTVIHAPNTLAGMVVTPTVAAMVELTNSASVFISNLTISGPDAPAGVPLYFGIYVGGDSTLNLSHVTVTDIHDSPVFTGAQHGVAIQVGRNANGQVGHAVIEDSTVVDYQKNGITVDNTGSTVIIRRTTVTGAGPTGVTAQNGIQISRGATGTVEDSTVTLNEYTGSGWTAAGILLYQAGSGVTLTGNNVTDNQTNISAFQSDHLTITDNLIQNATQYDNLDLDEVSGAAISGNRILDAAYDGIWIGSSSNVSITGNVFTGNGFGVSDPHAAAIHTADTNTLAGFVISGNSFSGNVNGVWNDDTVNAVDATGNWWGDGSGPFDDSPVSDDCGLMLDNPLAGGNAVSPCVIYDPWLTTAPGGGTGGGGDGGGDDDPAVPTQLPVTGGGLANVVSISEGESVTLDCTANDGTVLELANGDHVLLPCPITGEATLHREEADTLPTALDAGMSYVSGMHLGLAPDYEETTALDATIGLHFVIPAGQATEGLSVLHLDGGVWQDLGGAVGLDGTFEAPHAQTGIYLLVSK